MNGYEIEVQTSPGAYWRGWEPTLSEAAAACKQKADFWYTEARVLDAAGRVVLTSVCGADCIRPPANAFKRNRRAA